jgi:hypothetical protein
VQHSPTITFNLTHLMFSVQLQLDSPVNDTHRCRRYRSSGLMGYSRARSRVEERLTYSQPVSSSPGRILPAALTSPSYPSPPPHTNSGNSKPPRGLLPHITPPSTLPLAFPAGKDRTFRTTQPAKVDQVGAESAGP